MSHWRKSSKETRFKGLELSLILSGKFYVPKQNQGQERSFLDGDLHTEVWEVKHFEWPRKQQSEALRYMYEIWKRLNLLVLLPWSMKRVIFQSMIQHAFCVSHIVISITYINSPVKSVIAIYFVNGKVEVGKIKHIMILPQWFCEDIKVATALWEERW